MLSSSTSMSARESIATPVRPTSPSASGVVGVVAELRGEVEGDREPRLPALEEVAEARIRLLGRAVARVLSDRPRPPAVHRLVRAARERELARELELSRREVIRRVDGLDLDAGIGQPTVGRCHGLIVWAARVTGGLRPARSRRVRSGGRSRCASGSHAPRRPRLPLRTPRRSADAP